MNYRADIDGLRALAVLLVVLFHLDFQWITGGFTGVDVFFVISGYLITKIILKQLQQDCFSFINFFTRRAKRLLPAAVVTIALSLIAGAMIYPPLEMVTLAKSAISAALYFANIYFWQTSDYFSLDVHLKPLLHMWSLSVEEQFYFVWPVVIFFSYKFFKKKLDINDKNLKNLALSPLMVIAAIFLLFSIFYLEQDESAVFYLMPFRMHEFALGALTVLLESRKFPRIIEETSPFIGLGMIFYSALSFTSQTSFPGLNSLYPTIGTLLILLFPNASLIRKVLEFSWLRYIGHISYSFYLVHWPAICIYKKYTLKKLNLTEQIGLFLFSIAASVLMYYFIENPFRRGLLSKFLSPKITFAAFLATTFSISALAIFVIQTQGWPGRYAQELKSIISIATDTSERTQYNGADDSCFIGDGTHVLPYKEEFNFDCLKKDSNRKNILILGDSFAAYSTWGLKQAFPEYHFLQSTMAGCWPILYGPVNTENCKDRNEHMFNEYDYSKVSAIILMANWTDKSVEVLPRTVEALLERFPKLKVILLGPTPEFDHSIPLLFAHYKSIENTKRNIGKHILREPFDLDNLFRKQKFNKQVLYISMTELLCQTPNNCLISTENGLPMFIDGHHLYYKTSHLVFQKKHTMIRSFLEDK